MPVCPLLVQTTTTAGWRPARAIRATRGGCSGDKVAGSAALFTRVGEPKLCPPSVLVARYTSVMPVLAVAPHAIAANRPLVAIEA